MQKILLADLSIILVEPSDTQRKIISTLLHKENVENVNAVSNVKEAIEAINKQGADLVVSSMYLEDGTGVDILKSIKNSPEHCSIPFMLVSSENRPEKLEEFKRKAEGNLALDGGGHLTYLAPSRVNLTVIQERWPEIEFRATREIA